MNVLTKIVSFILSGLIASVAVAGADNVRTAHNPKAELMSVKDIPAGTSCIDRDQDSGNCKRLIDPKTTTIYKKANEKWLYEEHDTDLARKLSQP